MKLLTHRGFCVDSQVLVVVLLQGLSQAPLPFSAYFLIVGVREATVGTLSAQPWKSHFCPLLLGPQVKTKPWNIRVLAHLSPPLSSSWCYWCWGTTWFQVASQALCSGRWPFPGTRRQAVKRRVPLGGATGATPVPHLPEEPVQGEPCPQLVLWVDWSLKKLLMYPDHTGGRFTVPWLCHHASWGLATGDGVTSTSQVPPCLWFHQTWSFTSSAFLDSCSVSKKTSWDGCMFASKTWWSSAGPTRPWPFEAQNIKTPTKTSPYGTESHPIKTSYCMLANIFYWQTFSEPTMFLHGCPQG